MLLNSHGLPQGGTKDSHWLVHKHSSLSSNWNIHFYIQQTCMFSFLAEKKKLKLIWVYLHLIFLKPLYGWIDIFIQIMNFFTQCLPCCIESIIICIIDCWWLFYYIHKMSFNNRLKRNVPRMDPWAIPLRIVIQSLTPEPILTHFCGFTESGSVTWHSRETCCRLWSCLPYGHVVNNQKLLTSP